MRRLGRAWKGQSSVEQGQGGHRATEPWGGPLGGSRPSASGPTERLVTSHLGVLRVLHPHSGSVLSPPLSGLCSLLSPDGGDITPTPGEEEAWGGGGGGQGVPEAARFPGVRVGMGMGVLGMPGSLLGSDSASRALPWKRFHLDRAVMPTSNLRSVSPSCSIAGSLFSQTPTIPRGEGPGHGGGGSPQPSVRH